MSGSQQLILGEGAGGVVANYIEDVFSTWLYTGNGSTQTITNGIDLSTKGGLVWMKDRSTSFSHALFDTARGGTSVLATNLNDGASPFGSISGITFNSNGFYLPDNNSYGWTNTNNTNYVSWTFRKQPKFFDVVTYTGNGVSGRSISHNLGSVPGCIIVKRTDQAADWAVYHRGVNGGVNPQNYKLLLNLTNAQALDNWWNDSAPTSTAFQVSSDPTVNDGATGATYVAYLFAHDAGGFGLTGTDNVISCGSYVGTSANFVDVNLGYEPQWFMVKRASDTSPWFIIDNMRDMSYSGTSNLQANASNAEQATVPQVIPSATGISLGYSGGGSGYNVNGVTYIYIAIRRGPMKTPTTGTSVFAPVLQTASSGATVTTNFPVDLNISAQPSRNAFPFTLFIDRLRGTTTSSSQKLASSSTNGEANFSSTSGYGFDFNTSVKDSLWVPEYAASGNIIYWNLRRAPGFFDVVCYTGTGSARTVTHNLGVAPELMIIKVRNNTSSWFVWGGNMPITNSMFLNQTQESLDSAPYFNDTLPTASVFSVSSAANFNGETLVAYLFASCPGVSKVGSYTGSGTTKQIDCGFTGGARFVLIKRTDSTGDWYCWDSARGIVASTDPYLVLNSTAAEVTTTDWVDTYSAGFELSNAAGNNVNINAASYIFLSIA